MRISWYFIYVVEIILGIIIITFSIKWFLLLAFISILITLDLKIDHLRKLIRVSTFSLESKNLIIMEKLNLTEDEINKISNKNWEKQDKRIRESMDKDIRDVTQWG